MIEAIEKKICNWLEPPQEIFSKKLLKYLDSMQDGG